MSEHPKEIMDSGDRVEFMIEFNPAGAQPKQLHWTDAIQPRRFRYQLGWRIWEFRAQLESISEIIENGGEVGVDALLRSLGPARKMPLWRSIPIVLRGKIKDLLHRMADCIESLLPPREAT